jgi:hypothetical protein
MQGLEEVESGESHAKEMFEALKTLGNPLSVYLEAELRRRQAEDREGSEAR